MRSHILPLMVAALYIGVFAPSVVLGAPVTPPKDFKGLLALLTNIIQLLIYVIIALTFLTFAWGVIRSWIVEAGESDSVESGKQYIITGIIAFVVMTCIWGILHFLQATFWAS